MSLRVPLIPRRRGVLTANSDPLAHIERRRIKPVNVDVLKDAWPEELPMDIKLAA
uniref:KAK n=1 Tax=Arundo donax TaxID=35708 RepID=A0A0A9GPW3_ARUDO